MLEPFAIKIVEEALCWSPVLACNAKSRDIGKCRGLKYTFFVLFAEVLGMDAEECSCRELAGSRGVV